MAADHRGSILGDHPTRLQPPQKMFESKLLHQMRNFSVHRPVFIESESSLVGRRQVPNAMWKVRLQHLLSVPERDAQVLPAEQTALLPSLGSHLKRCDAQKLGVLIEHDDVTDSMQSSLPGAEPLKAAQQWDFVRI